MAAATHAHTPSVFMLQPLLHNFSRFTGKVRSTTCHTSERLPLTSQTSPSQFLTLSSFDLPSAAITFFVTYGVRPCNFSGTEVCLESASLSVLTSLKKWAFRISQ